MILTGGGEEVAQFQQPLLWTPWGGVYLKEGGGRTPADARDHLPPQQVAG